MHCFVENIYSNILLFHTELVEIDLIPIKILQKNILKHKQRLKIITNQIVKRLIKKSTNLSSLVLMLYCIILYGR